MWIIRIGRWLELGDPSLEWEEIAPNFQCGGLEGSYTTKQFSDTNWLPYSSTQFLSP